MSVFRALGNLFSKQEAAPPPPVQKDEGHLRHKKVTDVTFSDANPTEATLHRLWKAHAHGDQEDSKAAFSAFVVAFVAAYDSWQPCEVPSDTGSPGGLRGPGLRPAQPSRGEGGSPRVIVGCSTGHPHDVLGALVRSLEGLPGELGSASHGGVGAGGAWRSPPAQWLAPLAALQIAARSADNRAVLVQQRALPALHRLLKATVSRAVGALASLEVAEGAPSEGPRLPLLGELLAATADTLSALAGGDLRAARGPGGALGALAEGDLRVVRGSVGRGLLDGFLEGPPAFACGTACEPATKGEAEALERAARPYLEEGFVERLVEGLRAVVGLRARGAILNPAHVAALLSCLLDFVTASGAAQAALLSQDRGPCGLLVIMEGLGSPAHLHSCSVQGTGSILDWAPVSNRALTSARDLEDELRVQLLTLQLVAATTKRSKAGLQIFEEGGGGHRLTQLLQWVALTFGPPRVEDPGSPDAQEASTSNTQGCSSSFSGSCSGIVVCRPLEELFAALASWLAPVVDLRGRGNAAAAESRGASRRSHWCRLCRLILPSLLGAFDPHVPSGPSQGHELSHAAAAATLASGAGPAQNYLLRLVTQSLKADTGSLALLRNAGLWDTIYGPAFFFAGADSTQPLAAFRLDEGFLDAEGLLPRHADPASTPLLDTPLHDTLPNDNRGVPSNPPGVLPVASGSVTLASPSVTLASPSATLASTSVTLASPSVTLASQSVTLASYGPHAAGQSSEEGRHVSSDGGNEPCVTVPGGGVRPARQSGGPEGDAGVKSVPSQRRRALAELRRRVVDVTEVAAAVPNGGGPRPEPNKLLDLLDNMSSDPEIVLLAAPALTRLAKIVPEQGLGNLDTGEGLDTLARIIVAQQQATMEAEDLSTSPHTPRSHLGHGGAQSVPPPLQARLEVLTLLSSVLRRSIVLQRAALLSWPTVDALLALLWDRHVSQPALSQVLELMTTQPASEDERAAKAALFIKYVEALPRALASGGAGPGGGLPLACALLSGMRELVAANRTQHQAFFRHAECFVQIVNLLNFVAPGMGLPGGPAEQVLATLASLITGSEAGRARLRDTVGYDTLGTALGPCVGSAGPTRSLLLRLLGLVLEGEYADGGGGGQRVVNADAIPLFFSFLRRATPPEQAWGLAVWQQLAAASMANLAACDRAGINGLLIDWFAKMVDVPALQERIAALLQVTAAYSISGRDLRAVFGLLRKDPATGRVPAHSFLLLRSLRAMARHEGPTTFFDFANEAAGIMRTTALRFPGSKGYSFATWLRLDRVDTQGQGAGRSLFALLHRGGDGVRGVCAAVLGNRLVVRCHSPKVAEVVLDYRFEAKRWYHVVLTHSTGSALTPSWARLFVNGLLEASARFRYPKLTEPINACSFAARLGAEESGLATPVGAFLGQMGCVYLFEDVLSPGQVDALHELGPDYQSTFRASESDPVLEQAPAAAALLLDPKEGLAPRLLLSYNAQAAAGRLLYDTGGMEGGGGEEADTAAILEGSQLCCTHQLRDMLHCMGGVPVLLPLLAHLDAPSRVRDAAGGEEPSRAVEVVELLTAVLDNCPSNRQSLEQISGVALAGYLLSQRSPRHLSAELLRALEGLAAAVQLSVDLRAQVLRRLILNLRLWSPAPLPAHRLLLTLAATHLKADPLLVAQVLPVPSLLDAVRQHYGPAPVQATDAARTAGPGVLTPMELRLIRRGFLLEVAGTLLQKLAVSHLRLSPLDPDVAQALVAFVGDCPEPTLLEDVLELLLNLLRPVSPTRPALMAHLQAMGGPALFITLLQREQQPLRLQGIRLLSVLLGAITAARAAAPDSSVRGAAWVPPPGFEPAGLWALVSDSLLMFPLTRPVREALLDLLCPGGPAGAGASPPLFAAPVVAILLRLLPACSDAGERLAALAALHALIVDGPKENRAAVVAQPAWEEGLLDLLQDGSPCLAHAHPPAGAHAHSPAGAHAHSPAGAHAHPPAGEHAHSSAAGHAHSPADMHAHSSGDAHAHPSAAGHAHPSGSGHAHSPADTHAHSSGDAHADSSAAGHAHSSAGEQAHSSARGYAHPSASGHAHSSAGEHAHSSPREDEAASLWAGPEEEAVRGILRALYRHCIAELPRGWLVLQRGICRLRAFSSRAAGRGWALAQALLADVAEDLLAQLDRESLATTDDAWLLVSFLANDRCRDNALGLLGLMDDLIAGAIVGAGGAAPGPSPQAASWAQQQQQGGAAGAIPPEGWAALGVPDASTLQRLNTHHSAATWRLVDAATGLMAALLKAVDPSASLSPRASGATPRSRFAGRETAESGRPTGSSSRPSTPDSAADRGNRGPFAGPGPRQGLTERGARMTFHLLLLLLRQPGASEDTREELLRRLPLFVDASSTASKDRIHLLLACLVRLRIVLQAGGAGHGALRQLGQSAASIAAVTWAPLDNTPLELLPLYTDPHFWAAVESAVSWERAALAAAAEIGALVQAAAGAEKAWAATEADGERRALEERRTRSSALEAAREVLGAVCAADKARRAAARVAHEEEQVRLGRQWRDLQRALTAERGLWGAADDAQHLRWKLDRSEDRSRRRLKLKRNYRFVMYNDPVRGGQAPPPPAAPETQLETRLSGIAALKRKGSMEEEEEDVEELAETPREGDEGGGAPPLSSAASESLVEDEREAEGHTGKEQEQALYSTACMLVRPRHVTPGTLRVTKTYLYFTGDPTPDDSAGPGPGSEANTGSKNTGARGGRVFKRWAVAGLLEVHHARFLLQPWALELFFGDGGSAMMNFESTEIMKEAALRISALSPRIVVLDRKRKLELASKLQQRWQRWEMSNFDYLMQLNTLAGRTYNDLNQYPVFPWVLADYESDSLDLNSPASFRDLSKPVGALNEKRLNFFLERYESLRSDPDVPPFHYGSHYSSAGAVLYYLIRLEPFTALNRNLQGGRFDHADRLFHSVAATWRNCLEGSSDVKELTPEFFYHPDFLLNSNHFRLGTRQDGIELGDVELPPWAAGSPDEFVRVHREALECDYVSERLPEWIDLIFGSKQRGTAAEAAANVFYYLTYEGAVDLRDIDDPVQRTAVEDQISHFGQTPSQLFRRKHPKRGPPPSPALRPLLNAPDAMKLATVGMPASRRPNIAVARLEAVEGRVILINADRAVSRHRWLSPRDQVSFTFGGMGEAGYGMEADGAPPRMLGTPFAADLDSGHCYAILAGGQVVAGCGYWDNSIRCYAVDDGRLLQSLRLHKDIVTCIAVGPDERTLVSGSRDTTLIIWDVVARPRGRVRGPAPLPLRERPRHVLTGHEDAVLCLALCPDLDLVASGSADGMILLHTLQEGRYVRMLTLPGNGPPVRLAISAAEGVLLAHSWRDLALHLFTINGRRLVSAEGTERLNTLVIPPDGRLLLTGGAKGFVTLRWLHSLQVVLRYDGGRGAITALGLTPEECILAGTAEGAMLVFAPDSRRRITRRLPLADVRVPGAGPVPPGPERTLRFDF